jgi:small-conductance mechanosensitive channel
MQTTIMEMGQPPPVQQDEPAMWVQSREYTGRIVTVSNATIFSEPVYNYTRNFPYIWEEIAVPIGYKSHRRRAEEILLEAAERHAISLDEIDEDALKEIQRRYLTRPADVRPRVYYRLTDNWLEMSLRFIIRDYGIREAKDAMSRDILRSFEKEGIEIASTTIDVVGLPEVNLQMPDSRRSE